MRRNLRQAQLRISLLVGFPPPGLRGRPCPAFLCGVIPLNLDEIRLPRQDSHQPVRSPILLPRADQART
jgi:hypothetical protein